MHFLSPARLVHAYLRKLTNRQVFGGPFAGMYYVKESSGSAYFPKLLGTYEKELHEIIHTHQEETFEKIIVIGAAEGYYAVGLAKKWKRPTLAFEANTKARELLTRMALINRVSVFVKGKFEQETDTKSNKDFIIMDVEGEEEHLLTAQRFGDWRQSTILAEVHSLMIKNHLQEIAGATHHTSFIPVRTRTMKDYPFPPPFSGLLKRWWWACLQEWREESIGWLIFDPKA